MNCPNCGAPMKYAHKCQYCGSKFNTADCENGLILLQLGDEVIYCYLERVETEVVKMSEYGADMYGRMRRVEPEKRRTFILREF